ncbi:MAG: type I-E CRISPR-associated protein Cas6/Cse3/CasE [Azospirillaceae bacterium]|nr:type I-E CRISPR-associated protein Cas6/Cse3/CasE [Azospirillaceae bacterium]
MAAAALSMVQLPLDNRRLAAFAASQSLSADLTRGDGGYVGHALLTALFGAMAPQPFAIRPRAGTPGAIDLLAYSHHPLEALRATAELTALPVPLAAIDWVDAADKRMPLPLPAGMALGFQVRACPTIRMARGATRKHPGAEVDAFLAAIDQAEAEAAAAGTDDTERPFVDRQAVYGQWLTTRIPGAAVTAVRLAGFRHSDISRRGTGPKESPRPLISIQKPDALFEGLLTVTDSALFAATVARGVGRHRAFGFGMLLLRPVAR